MSFFPHIPQSREDQHTDGPLQNDIDHTENIYRQSGKIAFLQHVQRKYDQEQPKHVGLDHICQDKPAPLHVHRLIERKSLIQKQIARNYKNQGKHILLKR